MNLIITILSGMTGGVLVYYLALALGASNGVALILDIIAAGVIAFTVGSLLRRG